MAIAPAGSSATITCPLNVYGFVQAGTSVPLTQPCVSSTGATVTYDLFHPGTTHFNGTPHYPSPTQPSTLIPPHLGTFDFSHFPAWYVAGLTTGVDHFTFAATDNNGASWSVFDAYGSVTPAGQSVFQTDPNLPVSASIETNGSGGVTLAGRGRTTQQPPGWTFLGDEYFVVADPQSAADPLRFTVTIDSTIMAQGVHTPLAIFRDGVQVQPCTQGHGTTAAPDPCVDSEGFVGGDYRFVVLSSHASVWNVGETSAADSPLGSTCSVSAGGVPRCSGHNEYGQLGDGTTTNSSASVSVLGISNAVQAESELYHSCAVLTTGAVKCWGHNLYGELGNGSTTQSSVPVTVSGISNAQQVSVGDSSSCAVLSTGTVMCWGGNWNGQVGDGTTQQRSTPVSVTGITNAVQVSVGGMFACARLSTGAIRCWGLNEYGQLGDGTTVDSGSPVNVAGISNATDVSAGLTFTCAALAGGSARCWGANFLGQLGDGTTTDRHTATPVLGIGSAAQVGAGGGHACERDTSGTVRCWGYTAFTPLGGGAPVVRTSPVTVPGISAATQIAAGFGSSCALFATNNVTCWGTG